MDDGHVRLPRAACERGDHADFGESAGGLQGEMTGLDESLKEPTAPVSRSSSASQKGL